MEIEAQDTIIDLVREDGTHITSISFSAAEMSYILMAADTSGMAIEEFIIGAIEEYTRSLTEDDTQEDSPSENVTGEAVSGEDSPSSPA